MAVPRLLYKYRAGNIQDLVNLSAAKIWISSPTRFNDPFDCAYDVAISNIDRAQCVALLDRMSNGQLNEAFIAQYDDATLFHQVKEGLKKAVATGLSGFSGVCCFSAAFDDHLSWGHYADCHRGFCLEFDTTVKLDPAEKLAAGTDDLFDKVHEVKYSDTFANLGVDTFTNEDYPHILELMALTKRKCWEHEREWRVLHPNADFAFSYNRASLTGIYFGAMMPMDQIQMICTLLNGTDTKLYRMHLDKARVELVPESFTFTKIDYRK